MRSVGAAMRPRLHFFTNETIMMAPDLSGFSRIRGHSWLASQLFGSEERWGLWFPNSGLICFAWNDQYLYSPNLELVLLDQVLEDARICTRWSPITILKAICPFSPMIILAGSLSLYKTRELYCYMNWEYVQSDAWLASSLGTDHITSLKNVLF